MSSLTLQSLLFRKKQGVFLQKSKGFSLRGTPKILGKERKNAQKGEEKQGNREKKSKEIKKKQGKKEGQGSRIRWPFTGVSRAHRARNPEKVRKESPGSARAPLCCKSMCCAARFCTDGGGAAGSKFEQNVQGPMKQNARPGAQSEAPRRRCEPGRGQHPRPQNQDSQHMIDQPKGSFPDWSLWPRSLESLEKVSKRPRKDLSSCVVVVVVVVP